MNADLQKLRKIFEEAAGRDTPEARAAYLDEACRGDAELRAAVERLFEAETRAGDFLEAPVMTPVGTPVLEGPGALIGHYKLLEEIGEGAFGRVFMAEQTAPVRRKVALKIIKAGMDTREVIARFEAERQALALMEHPNIARILDAGATESGRPFFVMELVRGLPITEYCDRNDLRMAERLQLFLKVCQAVQHAHQKGIIHRDLKPTNILVTMIDGEPVPKIIDFGIAKALGQQLTEKTLFTAFAQVIGTPAYMSPEQTEFSGVDVDTRSDIYSLGVLLYELLTGVTPLDAETLRKAGIEEIRRLIRETDPPKPSTRLRTLGDKLADVAQHRHAEPSALARQVHGDLDWIVMKALEKDRSRRYEAASALVQDIQHHLHHEPVLAGPPSAVYRTHKFVRRHRFGAAVSATAVAALLVALLAAVVGFLEVRQERNRALTAEQQALQEQGRAAAAEQVAEQERDQARLLAAEAALEKGQAKLEAGDSRGLWDFVMAYELADHHPGLQDAIGRRWSMWHAYWGGRTMAVRPTHDGTPSPDYLQFASVSIWPENNASSVVNLYDMLTGTLVAGPMVHGSIVKRCVFSPDGRLLATVTEDGVIHLWDTRTGRPVRPPCETGIAELVSLSFSACGRYLVAFPRDHTETRVAVLRLREPRQPAHLLEHRYPVVDTRFSPNGEVLAVLAKPDLQVWRTADLQPLGLPLTVTMAALLEFHPDGTRLACHPEGLAGVGLLDPQTRQIAQNLPKEYPQLTDCSFSHDGRLLATFDWDCNLRLWRTDSVSEPYATHNTGVRMSGRLAFNHDDTLLAAGGVSGVIRVLRTSDGHTVHTLHTPRNPQPAFLANGVLASEAWGVGFFWDLAASPLPSRVLQHDTLAYTLQFDPSGDVLAVGSEDELRLWTMKPSPRLERIVPMPGRVRAVTFSEEHAEFVAFSEDGSLTMVEPRSGKATAKGNFGCGYGASACLSPDARKVALFFPRLSSPLVVGTRAEGLQWLDHASGARSVAFRHDSRRMAVGTAGWQVCLYDISADANALIGCSGGFGGWVECVAYHPSGRLLAVCVEEHVIHLYEPESNRRVFSGYRPSLAGVNLLRFSPDGALLAAAGRRSEGGYGVEIWHVDLHRGLHRASPTLPCEHPVWSVAFSPDNRALVTGGLGSTRCWHLPLGPEDLEDVQARTQAAMGFRLDDEGNPVCVDPPTSGIEAIRARLTQEPVSDEAPLEAALGLPLVEAVVALQQLADQHPEANVYQKLRGRLHADLMVTNAQMRLSTEALTHAGEAIRLGHNEPYTRYCRALLSLETGDVAAYRDECRAMAEHYQTCSDPAVVKWIGWTAALAPGALDDYAELVEKLRHSALRVSGLHGPAYRFYLGAVLARADRYAEAADELEEVNRHLKEFGAYVDFSPAYCKFLLAICHVNLGHERNARQWFDAAALDVQSLLQDQGGPAVGDAVAWNRRLTLELLQKEAEAALSTLAPQTTSSG